MCRCFISPVHIYDFPNMNKPIRGENNMYLYSVLILRNRIRPKPFERHIWNETTILSKKAWNKTRFGYSVILTPPSCSRLHWKQHTNLRWGYLVSFHSDISNIFQNYRNSISTILCPQWVGVRSIWDILLTVFELRNIIAAFSTM